MFNPKYTITDQIVNQLSQIAEIKSIVERSRLLPAKEIFLKRAAIVKMAHTSTSIEGNRLQEYQVAKLMQGIKIQADSDQIKEVGNYLSALKLVDRLAQSKIEERDILNIHKIVVNAPPDSNEVPGLVKNLLEWLNKSREVHPIIRAGLFHYQFETIHPFTDGNGRTGRLLTLLHLYQSAWDFKKILVLEDYYNRDRKKYYQALQTGKTYKSRQRADLTKWLEYFVEGFLDEAKRVKDAIINISVIPDINTQRNILTTDELKIVDFTISIGRITSSDVVDILQVPKRTAQAKIKRLEDIRVLEKHGAGPATYYVIPKII